MVVVFTDEHCEISKFLRPLPPRWSSTTVVYTTPSASPITMTTAWLLSARLPSCWHANAAKTVLGIYMYIHAFVQSVLVAQVVEHWSRNLVVVSLSPVQDSSGVSLSSTVCFGRTALSYLFLPHLTSPPLSQLQCVHFSSWDSVKDWSLPLPSKESINALSLGNGWIAVATNKQLLRVFSLGGVQCDVISVAGVIVGVAGWGARLAVIYQEAPCEYNHHHPLHPFTPSLLSHPLTPLSLAACRHRECVSAEGVGVGCEEEEAAGLPSLPPSLPALQTRVVRVSINKADIYMHVHGIV